MLDGLKGIGSAISGVFGGGGGKFTGMGAIEGSVASQFTKFQFPLATKEGSRIHMMWTDCPCRITCWNGGNDTEVALRSPQIECIVTQHPWLENDTVFSDIILPVNTHMEVDDIITNVRQGGQWANVMLADKAIEPLGESKSDYECVLEIAKKLGYEKQVSDGGATVEHIRLMRATVGPDFGVKASGGIRDRATAEKLLAAGATRLGCSASVAIVRGEGGSQRDGY